MAQYTGIQGQNILIVSSDPANPVEGQIWYNTTSNTLKGYQFAAINTWASGGNMNGQPRGLIGGAGIQTAALAFGGETDPVGPAPQTTTNVSEEYDGTTWTSGGNYPIYVRSLGGAGSQTAAVGFAGLSDGPNGSPLTPSGATTVTAEYNGTSWTAVNPTSTAAYNMGGSGSSQNSALKSGGTDGSGSAISSTEEYNGTNWTSGGSLPAVLSQFAQAGDASAAIAFGGSPGPGATSQTYNGTSWTSTPNLNTARSRLGGAGIQTLAIAFAGTTPITFSAATELWNGTSWTSSSNMATARQQIGSANPAPSNAAIGFGGPGASGRTFATEEWTGTALATRTITTS
jgi:hypothetical protein